MKRLVSVILIALSIGCESEKTTITGTWKNPSPPNTYHVILVTALTSNAVAKNTIETELAYTLGSNGVHAISGIDKFPPNYHASDTDKTALMNEVHKTNADAILTISLLKQETKTRYVPGSLSYDPFSGPVYYRDFWGYYRYWYPYEYDPGYYVDDKTYYFVLFLFVVSFVVFVWSAQSATYNP